MYDFLISDVTWDMFVGLDFLTKHKVTINKYNKSISFNGSSDSFELCKRHSEDVQTVDKQPVTP